MRRSCAGLEERPQQRYDEAPDAGVHQVWILASRSCSSSGRTISPRESTRSRTPTISSFRDQRLGAVDPGDVALVLERNPVRPLARASDQRRVLKALRYQQAEFRPLALDQPVHRQRGRVADDRRRRRAAVGRDPEPGRGLLDRLVHPDREIVCGRSRLAPDAPGAVRYVAVGERAADVDVDRCVHAVASSVPRLGLERVDVELDVVS